MFLSISYKSEMSIFDNNILKKVLATLDYYLYIMNFWLFLDLLHLFVLNVKFTFRYGHWNSFINDDANRGYLNLSCKSTQYLPYKEIKILKTVSAIFKKKYLILISNSLKISFSIYNILIRLKNDKAITLFIK